MFKPIDEDFEESDLPFKVDIIDQTVCPLIFRTHQTGPCFGEKGQDI
jgi:hypothetical protein